MDRDSFQQRVSAFCYCKTVGFDFLPWPDVYSEDCAGRVKVFGADDVVVFRGL